MASISTGTCSVARKQESLNRIYQSPISFDTIEGKLASFIKPGGQGALYCDFTKRRGDMPPHSGLGALSMWDVNNDPFISDPSAETQIEEGAMEGKWHVVSNMSIRVVDQISGRLFIFWKIGEDETSIRLEFAASDDSSLGSWSAAMNKAAAAGLS